MTVHYNRSAFLEYIGSSETHAIVEDGAITLDNPLGPASVMYWKNGLKAFEIWMKMGKHYRDNYDGPVASTQILVPHTGKWEHKFYFEGDNYDFGVWIEKVNDKISPEQEKTLREKYGQV